MNKSTLLKNALIAPVLTMSVAVCADYAFGFEPGSPLEGVDPTSDRIVSSVFDRTLVNGPIDQRPYTKDGVVEANYGGKTETGKKGYGVYDKDCYRKDSIGTDFIVGGVYKGLSSIGAGRQFLCYDGHPGVDLVVPDGSIVMAVEEGEVTQVERGYPDYPDKECMCLGNFVEITHEKSGYVSRYGHLKGGDEISVKKGETVSKGWPIARTGNSGSTDGPHLHLEMKTLDGKPVDPYDFWVVPSVPSTKFSYGDVVSISELGKPSVYVRMSAGGDMKGKAVPGDEGEIIGGPIYASGYWRWEVNFESGLYGWVAEDFLEKDNVAPENVIFANGKQWMQPDLFTNLSWNQINAVCPAGACKVGGKLNGQDMTGWRWASNSEVAQLLNSYGVTPPLPLTFIGSLALRSLDNNTWSDAFYADGWRVTAKGEVASGYWTTLGMTSTTNTQGTLWFPYMQGIRIYSKDNVSAQAVIGWKDRQDVDTGAWFYEGPADDSEDIVTANGKEWLQADLFTNLSWNQINAVCPSGVCKAGGVLNGHDMTGWTWATQADMALLFSSYGPPLIYEEEIHYDAGIEGGVFKGDVIFDAGWRTVGVGPYDGRILTGYLAEPELFNGFSIAYWWSAPDVDLYSIRIRRLPLAVITSTGLSGAFFFR